MRRHILPLPLVLALAGALSCGERSGDSAVAAGQSCADPKDCRLWEAGTTASVRVGLASGLPQGRQREIVLAESNIHENHAFSWAAIWPERNRWAFDNADGLYDFAEDNRLFQAGFHFAWEQVALDDLPAWVLAVVDPDELRALLRQRARVIFQRYPHLDRINVINEPLRSQTGLLRRA